MKELEPILEPFRAAILDSAKSFFELCSREAGQDTLYGMALCPDNDLQSFYWMANTLEASARQAKEWLSEVKKSDPSLKYDTDFAKAVWEYEVHDWCFSEDTFNHPSEVSAASNMLEDVWKNVKSELGSSIDDDSVYDNVIDSIRGSLGDGLGRFNAIYNYKIPRDDFILLVSDPDPSDPEAFTAIAKAINPPASFERFASLNDRLSNQVDSDE